MLMDPFLLRLSAIAKLSQTNESAVLLPELILALNNKTATPITVTVHGKMTIISGLTDYAVLVLDSDLLQADIIYRRLLSSALPP
jgi:hypothetical protein